MAQQLKTMDVPALLAMRGKIDALLATKRRELERALAALGGEERAGKAAKPGNGRATAGRKGKRAKAKPKYQSKKTKGLKWSGRGMTPVWMRNEMKGTKLTKENFLIR